MDILSKPIVVNLFGGPGAGKSTIRGEVFAILKWRNVLCEEAPEFAKELVWDESFRTLENQILVFGNQLQRVSRLVGKVDVVITDSPLLLSVIYDVRKNENFKNFVLDIYREFDNFDVFIEREKPYVNSGRTQDEETARKIDNEIKNFLNNSNIPYTTIQGNSLEANKLANIIQILLNHKKIHTF